MGLGRWPRLALSDGLSYKPESETNLIAGVNHDLTKDIYRAQ